MRDDDAEREMIRNLLSGNLTPDTMCGSTSEVIAACLAVGRMEALPEPYSNVVDAWERLNAVQRRVVAEFNPTFRDDAWDTPVYYG